MINIKIDKKTDLLTKKIFFSVNLVLFLFYLFVLLVKKGLLLIFSKHDFCFITDQPDYINLSTKINWIPFKNIWQYTVAIFQGTESHFNSNIPIDNLFGNLLMFLPFPIFLRLFKYTSFGSIKNLFYKLSSLKSTILLVLIFDVSISLIRFLFIRFGIFDIDDIILNLLGTFIGYFMFVKLTNKLSAHIDCQIQ